MLDAGRPSARRSSFSAGNELEWRICRPDQSVGEDGVAGRDEAVVELRFHHERFSRRRYRALIADVDEPEPSSCTDTSPGSRSCLRPALPGESELRRGCSRRSTTSSDESSWRWPGLNDATLARSISPTHEKLSSECELS